MSEENIETIVKAENHVSGIPRNTELLLKKRATIGDEVEDAAIDYATKFNNYQSLKVRVTQNGNSGKSRFTVKADLHAMGDHYTGTGINLNLGYALKAALEKVESQAAKAKSKNYDKNSDSYK